MKREHVGFDNRIHYNSKGLPDVIVWMTLQMKKNRLQYGDIIFLYCQMRQYNKIGWPYIGPAVKSSNNKICVTSESVVLTEDIATYKWIILMQA